MGATPTHHSRSQKWGNHMQAGKLVSSDVSAFTSRVLVNGIERAHESWSINREIVGDLPEQVVAASGIRQASGTIAWAKQDGVTDKEANPWNASYGWLPKSGDRVVIYAGDGATEWVQFTGRIDEATGDVGGSPQSTIIDAIDQFNARFSHEPLQRIMPPLQRGDPAYRAVGLHSLYYVDTALRMSGFYSTPKREAVCAFSVPAQSSVWPEAGFLTAGLNGGPSGGPWAATHPAPWGVAMSNFRNEYAPAISSTLSRVVQYTLMVAPDHAGSGYFTGYYGEDAGNAAQLGVTPSRVVIARWRGVEVCRIAMGGATIVSLLISGDRWQLRTDAGNTSEGSVSARADVNLTQITVQGDADSRLAGFQIGHPTSATLHVGTTHVPSVKINWSGVQHAGILDAGPTLENVTALDLLKEIADATLTAMWIDERGVFQWVPSIGLRSQAPVQTVTTLDDIRALSWQDSLLGVRSQVQVDHKVPAITRHRWDNVQVHQGSGATLESGEQTSEIISPPPGTDWVGQSPAFYELGDAGSAVPMNGGWGNITGATLNNGTTEDPGGAYYSFSFSKIGPAAWKIIHNAGSLPAGFKLELRFPSMSSTIWERWWKESFPILRFFATTEWTDQTYSTAPNVNAWAPILVHDCGPWNNREGDDTIIRRIADYLASQTSTSQPTITGMRMGFDPRRQLGDVITVSSPTLMGVELRCLIVGISNSASDSFSQSLSVRIISAKSTFTTYDQLTEAWAGGNYASLQTAWAALNYGAMASNPLEVTP